MCLAFYNFELSKYQKMKISYNWLRNYIDIDLSPEKLAEVLTNTGLEVEGLEKFVSIKGGMEGLIIGEVVSCKSHPNADKLSLTTVNLGQGRDVPIVCGAPNVALGQKVLVATIGTTLYQEEDSFVIKKTKIRGEISEGMICAEDEVGLGKDHEGIMVLDPDSIVGMPAAEYFQIEHDDVFEIGLTPNRIDGASHIGVAIDIIAALKSDIAMKLNKPGIDDFTVDNHDLDIRVEVQNPQACHRYSGVSISGLRVGESPAWLQNRLKAIGLKPINNVVDITNYVLHETGQPLHAFDADKINGNKVVIKTLPNKTSFTTLDEENRELSDHDLMICNTQGGMCIAGVFGGIESGVSLNTKNIFLESACFDPVWIRKTAKRHGLNTDSSFRFERGTDPNGTLYALKRAALLLKELTGGKISSDIVDIYPEIVEPYPVRLTWANLDRLIGVQIPRDSVLEILQSLDIAVYQEDNLGLDLKVTTYRVEVRREVDVIEEILRIYGYNTIGLHDQVYSTLSYSSRPDPDQMENLISEQLVSQGFLEMMANSLTRSGYYSDNENFKEEQSVRLLNPLSSDLGVMRQSLLYGGLEAVILNIKHKTQDLRLFEFGNTYQINPEKNPFSTDAYFENRSLMLILTGKKNMEHWNNKQIESDFYQMKAYVGNVLNRLGYNINLIESTVINDSIFSEGLIYTFQNQEIARFGSLHTELLDSFAIQQPVQYADLNWSLIFKKTSLDVRYQEVTRYPAVRRDLALIIDQDIEFESIRQLAFHVERKLLKEVSLFDVFESDKLGKDKKSYAVSFIIQDEFKTLTDKRVDKVMSSLISAFENKLGAKLRQ